jgi:hypothetical protein
LFRAFAFAGTRNGHYAVAACSMRNNFLTAV